MTKVYRLVGESRWLPLAAEKHGWLWVHAEGLNFRSIATGKLMAFLPQQMEEVNEDADL